MIQKTKRPISILLVLLMIVGMFSVLPISASADVRYDGSTDEWSIGKDDIIHMESDSIEFHCFSVVLKAGTYKVAGSNEVAQSDFLFDPANGLGLTLDRDGFHLGSTTYVPVDANGYQSGSWLVLDVNSELVYTIRGMCDYYLVGTMNDEAWDYDDVTYELAKNPNTTADEYMLLDFAADANTQFKVVSAGEFIAPENNFTLNDAGTYDIYFRPDGSGNQADGWKDGKVFAIKSSPSATYVAQIGSTNYETLDAAIAAAQAGDTVKLLDTVTLTEALVIPEGKEFTLDLNGKDITGNVNDKLVQNKGTVVVDDSTAAPGHIYNTNIDKQGNAAFVNYGTATVKNGYFGDKNSDQTDANDVNRGAGFQNYGTAVIDGGYFTACDNFTPAEKNNNGYAYAIINYGTLTINDATVYGKNNGNLANNEGTMTVNGGNFSLVKGAKQNYYSIYNGTDSARSIVNGGTFTNTTGTALTHTGVGTTELNGGNFTFTKFEQSKTGHPTVSGGTFSKAVPEAYCAEGYLPVTNGDDTYTVGGPYVAKIGTTGYATLTDAIAAAQAGEIVTLLADINDTTVKAPTDNRFAYYVAGKAITIDGDNHAVTLAGRGFGVAGPASEVKFANITINNAAPNGRGIDTRGGNLEKLTLDNVTINATNGASQALTIGGNQAATTTVDIKNSNLESRYAITTFNPVKMTVDKSDITGWACFNVKAADSSAGSAGSEFTVTDSTLNSKNPFAGATNAYSLIKIEDNNVKFDITGSEINVTGEKNNQAIVACQNLAFKPTTNNVVNLGAGNKVTFDGDTSFVSVAPTDGEGMVISAGIFNAPVPEELCAEDMIPAVYDAAAGTYTVKTGAYVAQVGGTKYETFAEAVTAANGTEVITLLADAPAYVMTAGETLKVNKNSFNFAKPTVEGAYVVSSATADGVTTYTAEEAGVKYTSLSGTVTYSKTISSVGSGTYQLLKDITTTSYITPGITASDTTIDLNGHIFTSSNARSGFATAVLLSRNGKESAHNKFTIQNGKIVYTNANSPLSAITVGGKYIDVTIENVTIESAVCGIQVTGENQNVAISDSSITGTNDFALATNGSATKNATITVENSTLTSDGSIGVYLPGDADVTFTNTDVTGTTAMYIKGGNVTVDGGTITANGAAAEFSHHPSGANPTGDAIVVESCNYPAGVPALTISGAPTVTSANGVQVGDYTYGEVTAAKVTANTNTMTLPKGLEWIETDTPGVYTVGPADLFTGHSITLRGDVSLNFFIDTAAIENYDPSVPAKVVFTYDGTRTAEVDFANAPVSDGVIMATIQVPAAFMAHQIHAVVYYNGEAQTETDDYSIQQYAETLIEHPEYTPAGKNHEDLAKLMKEMLNYGAKAQTVFAGQVKEQAAYDDLTGKYDYHMAPVTAADIQAAIDAAPENRGKTATDLSTVKPEANATFYTVSVVFLSESTLKIVFKVPGGSTIAGQYDGSQKNTYYWVQEADIAAAELDALQTFTVGDATFNYSALDYAKVVLNNGNAAAQDLVSALYLYNQAANVFFAD